ncbi:uncharacterized protein LOC121726074 [Aricia agestis]|uniref:uncharacterized protein LOC121726074 n=1 Tax=Aricia agestis TaxID=91739 RepID=UPI001C20BFF8|nr:uncharacterized protein LOC121726074 [Aricia agestis]
MIFFFKMTAPYSNMKPKQQIKQIEPSFKPCPCMPLRIACFIMGYMTLFYTSLISICLLGFLVWLITEVGVFDLKSGEFLLGDFLIGHMISITIFVMLLNIFALVLTIVCLVGIHQRRPRLMMWHISFTATRMLITVATLGYNLLAGLNFGLLVGQLTDIGITTYYIYVFKSYMDQLHKEIKEAPEKCDNKNELIKVPIV